MKPLKVCIDARLTSGHRGGVEQVVIGLAGGLATLVESDQETYFFLCYENADEWLTPYLPTNAKKLLLPSPDQASRLHQIIQPLKNSRIGQKIAGHITYRAYTPSPSDGTIEKAGIDVMHFTWQLAFDTTVPYIYHPHDLQHIHLPQFFTPRQRTQRDLLYSYFCRHAAMVAIVSQWGKNDLIKQYDIPPDSIEIVPLAPPVALYQPSTSAEKQTIRNKYRLPPSFAFYPAQTWPHKNHEILLKAAARLKQAGLIIPLVFTGRQNEHYSVLQHQVETLGIVDQVRFLGFVSPTELKALYEMAAMITIPTRFEAASFPMWEAFSIGTPVICSNVTSLPAQAGDAALVVDPDDEIGFTNAMEQLWQDQTLQETLIARGKVRVSQFSWERTARHFRAHYRRLGNRPLTDEDHALLSAEPLL